MISSSSTLLHLLLVIFFGSVTLIGRAQNDFFQFDTNFPSRTLFPFVDGTVFNIKDLVDDGSIQRVVTILQSNIKQWSFIESQLLEPNVNLGMPEIFIPLRHLTTTLEVLGNILFMRDDIHEAKSSLERACPLMELLPASVNEDHRFAVGCFALLREVYGKLYSIREGGEREILGIEGVNKDVEIDKGVNEINGSGDSERDRGDYLDDDDDSGRRRGRRRRRKRGKLHNHSLPSSQSSDNGNTGQHHSEDSDKGEDSDQVAMYSSFDIDRRFEDLRSPYDHLRAELELQQRQESSSSSSSSSNYLPVPQIMYKEGTGLATATADLDVLVQRFVHEDNAGRVKLFRMAKDYYEAMTVHMAANPQLVDGLGRDLDIVLVYVEVLSKVNIEGGFGFISKELDDFNKVMMLSGSDNDNVADIDSHQHGDDSNYNDIDGDMSIDDYSNNHDHRDTDIMTSRNDIDDDMDDNDDVDDDYDDEYDNDDDSLNDFNRDIEIARGRNNGNRDDSGENENERLHRMNIADVNGNVLNSHGQRDILGERFGGISLDNGRVGGRVISGAGRIKRQQTILVSSGSSNSGNSNSNSNSDSDTHTTANKRHTTTSTTHIYNSHSHSKSRSPKTIEDDKGGVPDRDEDGRTEGYKDISKSSKNKKEAKEIFRQIDLRPPSTSKSRILKMLESESEAEAEAELDLQMELQSQSYAESSSGQLQSRGRFRSAPLSPSERNRFMVLNAFERALSESKHPSSSSHNYRNGESVRDRDRDRGKENDDSGWGSIHREREKEGRKRDNMKGRDPWNGHYYGEKRRDEPIFKMYDSITQSNLKEKRKRDILLLFMTFLILFVLLVLLTGVCYSTHRGVKSAVQNYRSLKSYKSRTHSEYFSTQLSLFCSLCVLLCAVLGIGVQGPKKVGGITGNQIGENESSRTSSISDIDDTPSLHGNKSKKDSRRGTHRVGNIGNAGNGNNSNGCGDFREKGDNTREPHTLLSSSSSSAVEKRENYQGTFFYELRCVLFSIWKEKDLNLNSSVATSAIPHTAHTQNIITSTPTKMKSNINNQSSSSSNNSNSDGNGCSIGNNNNTAVSQGQNNHPPKDRESNRGTCSQVPTSTPVKNQNSTSSRTATSKKEKISVSSKKKGLGTAMPIDISSVKKGLLTNSNKQNIFKSPTILPSTARDSILPPKGNNDIIDSEESSINSDIDGDSDLDSSVGVAVIVTVTAGNMSKEMPKLITVSALPAVIDPLDDDAGYSRCVRKGSVKSAAAAAAAAKTDAVSSKYGNNTHGPSQYMQGQHMQPKPIHSTSTSIYSNHHSHNLSAAPIVDAATVAQQRAAFQYYETLKERDRERARLAAAVGKNATQHNQQQQQQQQQQQPYAIPVSSPVAWSTAASTAYRIAPSASTSTAPAPSLSGYSKTYPVTHPSVPRDKLPHVAVKAGFVPPHTSAVPKGMTYASVAQNSNSGSVSIILSTPTQAPTPLPSTTIFESSNQNQNQNQNQSQRSSNNNGLGSTRTDMIYNAPSVLTPSSTIDFSITSKTNSTAGSCPASPSLNSIRRTATGAARIGVNHSPGPGRRGSAPGPVSDSDSMHISDLSASSLHLNSYLHSTSIDQQTSDQIQQMQLLSDVRSLSVRPEESTLDLDLVFSQEDYLASQQQQMSRSISSNSSYESLRGGGHGQSQYNLNGLNCGLGLGYLPLPLPLPSLTDSNMHRDIDRERDSARERGRENEDENDLLRGDIVDNIADMDIGTIDLSFALSNDIDLYTDLNLHISNTDQHNQHDVTQSLINTDMLYGMNISNNDQHIQQLQYDYIGLSQSQLQLQSQYSHSLLSKQQINQNQHLYPLNQLACHLEIHNDNNLNNNNIYNNQINNQIVGNNQISNNSINNNNLNNNDKKNVITQRSRGFSSGSQLDLSSQSPSGLSPNAPSFNPNNNNNNNMNNSNNNDMNNNINNNMNNNDVSSNNNNNNSSSNNNNNSNNNNTHTETNTSNDNSSYNNNNNNNNNNIIATSSNDITTRGMWTASSVGVGVSTATPVHQPVNRSFESSSLQTMMDYSSNMDYNEIQLQHQQQLQLQHQHYQDSLPQQYDLHFSQFMAVHLPLSLPLVAPMMQQTSAIQSNQSLLYAVPINQSQSIYYQNQSQDQQQQQQPIQQQQLLQQQQQQHMISQQSFPSTISSDTSSSHTNSPSAPPGMTLSANVLPILPYVLPPAVIGQVVEIGSSTIFNSGSGSGSGSTSNMGNI